jgi:CHAT domain-containing protein
LSDAVTVPWELLYPKDARHDAGFLVEQFPVTRAVFGRRPSRSLQLRPARFVLPSGSPAQAQAEIEALRALLDPDPLAADVIGTLQPLLETIREGNFGVLHFACHNRFDPADGSSIRLDGLFEPVQLTSAGTEHSLAATRPVVCINACRSAGQAPSYYKLEGWAEKFLRAGAGAFIGPMWAVRDETAMEFALELYRRLQASEPLGMAVMAARQVAASQSGDPTWLAYSVYGDPQARIS